MLYQVNSLYVYLQDREQFNKLLGDTEDWLYEDGENENKQVYLDKLADLRVCLNSVSFGTLSHFQTSFEAYVERQLLKTLWQKAFATIVVNSLL